MFEQTDQALNIDPLIFLSWTPNVEANCVISRKIHEVKTTFTILEIASTDNPLIFHNGNIFIWYTFHNIFFIANNFSKVHLDQIWK